MKLTSTKFNFSHLLNQRRLNALAIAASVMFAIWVVVTAGLLLRDRPLSSITVQSRDEPFDTTNYERILQRRSTPTIELTPLARDPFAS